MFRIGLNPYGLAYTVGLQGPGRTRPNPQPLGLDGFVALTRDLGLQAIELDWRWLTPLDADGLSRLSTRLTGLVVTYSHWLQQKPDDALDDAIARARALGAGVLRLHLTPVLEGARAHWGPRWGEMAAHARAVLRRDAGKAADAGLILAIENHQDFGSEELVALAESLGDHVGIVLDTGNPFSVGEDPVAFVRRASHRIRHVHLKDYVAQFTDEGFRLVRCAVGEGAVPLAEMALTHAARSGSRQLTASIECGALDARHIRLFRSEWWSGYPPRAAGELAVMLGRLRAARTADDADTATPWERGSSPDAIVEYEMAQLRKSVENLRKMGWLS